jgi:tyrosine-protein kinase Etk/Wzc
MMDNELNSQFSIDVTDYWLILRKRSVQVVLVFLAVLAAVVAYTLRLSPTYEAEAKIRIASRQPMATIEGAQISWYGVRGNELESEITLIANKESILATTLEILRQGKDSAPFVDAHEAWFYQDVLDMIYTGEYSPAEQAALAGMTPRNVRIRIVQLPQSNVVALKVEGEHPALIQALANVLAVVYRADYSRSRTQEAFETMEFIGQQVARLKHDIEANRQTLQKVSEENVYLGSVTVYRDELSRLRIELERLGDRYQPDHPRVVKQRQLVGKIEAQLARFPQTEREHTETVAARDQQLTLMETLGDLHLKAKIDYESKRLRAKDEIQIISRALGASKLRPNEKVNYLAGALFGLLLGCLSAFVWEGLDTSIGKIEDVERVTRLPVIAHIPLLNGRRSNHLDAIALGSWRRLRRLVSAFLPIPPPTPISTLDDKILFNYDPMSVAAEAYRTLRTNIQFAIGAGHQTGNVIAITSTSPQEGKTLTSTNLSIALAQMGKTTLLVEADMRRPQIAKLFRIDERPGLSDLLIGTAKPEQAIRTLVDLLVGNAEWEKLLDMQGIDHLHLLPCGTIPPNPTELLLSMEFRTAVEKLRARYDFIIIDTPPTLPVSDSSIVSTVADGTVLIYQSDTTSRHLLLRAIQTLRKNQAKMLGIVINQLSFDVVLQAHGKYGYQYGYSYGYGPPSDKPTKG